MINLFYSVNSFEESFDI